VGISCVTVQPIVEIRANAASQGAILIGSSLEIT
jgi:hypothetical protein